MAYLVGSSDSLNDLLSKLRAFAETLGWVTNFSSTTRWDCQSPLGDMFGAQIQNSTYGYGYSSIYFYGYESYSPGLLPTQQLGSSFANGPEYKRATEFCPRYQGPYTRHYFYGSDAYLHVVVEIQSGIFGHFSIGRLDRKGIAYSGGQYLQATNWVTDFDSYGMQESAGTWSRMNYSDSGGSRLWDRSRSNQVQVKGSHGFPQVWWTNLVTGAGAAPYPRHPDAALLTAGGNEFASRPMLVPNRVLCMEDTATGGRTFVLGETRDFAVVNISRSQPGDILIYGEDRWQVFPGYRMPLPRPYPEYNTSGTTGYAYLLRD